MSQTFTSKYAHVIFLCADVVAGRFDIHDRGAGQLSVAAALHRSRSDFAAPVWLQRLQAEPVATRTPVV